MAPRSYWKGYLKLSLVTCPVTMMPATSEGEKVRFRTLNRATGHRVEARMVDSLTGQVVEDDDEVKGYQSGQDAYVMLEDDEIDQVALDSVRTIDIDMFVPKGSIDWLWYDKPHYLAPDDRIGEEAFAVIRDAMATTGMAGMARLVLHGRERAVMLHPRERGIVLWTLHFGNEVRDPQTAFEAIGAEKVDAKSVALVVRLIEGRSKPWDPSMAHDPVQQRLLDIIAAKRKGKRPHKAKATAEAPSNVIDIMDALRKSLEAEGRKRR